MVRNTLFPCPSSIYMATPKLSRHDIQQKLVEIQVLMRECVEMVCDKPNVLTDYQKKTVWRNLSESQQQVSLASFNLFRRDDA